MKRKITDLVPRQVALDHQCARFADGSQITFTAYPTEDGDMLFRVTSAGIGQFGVTFEIPKPTETLIEVQKESEAWESSAVVARLIGKCIVAFSAFVRARFPWVTSSTYGNTASVTPSYTRREIRELKTKSDDEVRRTFAEDLYRVRYYESLGFEFDNTYEAMLSGWVDDLRDGTFDDGYVDDDGEASFNGDMLAMGLTIPDRYPECALLELRTGVCK